MELISSILIGIGLSVACGFKVFLPLLGMSIFALAGQLKLASEFKWIASYPALIAFMIATGLEVAEYYFPRVNNWFDKIAVPMSAAAGAIVTASSVAEISPFLRWTLAVIAGSGVSGTVKTKLAGVRKVSTATVGKFGLLLTTSEVAAAFLLTVLAVAFPSVVVICSLGLFILFIAAKKLRYFPK